jgi:hypothetical protein
MTAYLTEAPSPTERQLAKIAELEADKRRSRELSEASFQRSDTDGFLTQWAHDITARLDESKIELLRHGGHARFPVLCDADGNVVADRIYKFPNSRAPWLTVERWKLPNDLADRLGRRWIPVAGHSGKSRVQKALGLHEDMRWMPAYAKITTGDRESRGLSGCANAYVGIFRRDIDTE